MQLIPTCLFPFALTAARKGGGERAAAIAEGPMTSEFRTSARVGALPPAVTAEKTIDP